MLLAPFDYVRAEEHVLPYRVMFEELLQTGHADRTYHGNSFLQIVGEAFQEPSTQTSGGSTAHSISTQSEAEALLFRRISEIEDGYRQLAKLKALRKYCTGDESALNRLEAPLLQILHRTERSALCLSGGGIRSAAICLGALQALARFRDGTPGAKYDDLAVTSALEEFDYLSTVSGGGYIGSWLTAWTCRVDKENCAGVTASEAPPPAAAFHHVVRYLAGDVRHTSADPAHRAVRHLREYTSFLAPRLGFTLDTFTLAAIVMRNLFVNWIMILPILFTAASALQVIRLTQFTHAGLLPMLMHSFGSSLSATSLNNDLWWSVAALLFLAAGFAAGRRMPSSMPAMPVGTGVSKGERRVFLFFVLPLFLASQAIIRIWLNLGSQWPQSKSQVLGKMVAISFVGFLAICLVRIYRLLRHKAGIYAGMQFHPGLYTLAGVGASALVSVLLGLALYGLGVTAAKMPQLQGVLKDVATGLHWPGIRGSIGAMFAFPLVWILIMLASSLYSALLGFFEDDVDREWWARTGGLMMNLLLLWIVGIGIVAIAPDIAQQGRSLLGGISGVAGLTGLLGALGGSSTAGAVGASAGKKANLSTLGRFLTKHDLVLPVLCGVALLAAALVVSAAESALVQRMDSAHPLRMHWGLLGGFFVLSCAANLAININLFSLHGMYRMRLMRAFMGASNLQRLPNAFTGFDGRDNIEEAEVRTGAGVPLHLINTTVNLVGTTNAAWRQRKAEGFTVSPLHSGGWRLGYTRTGAYGGPKGLTLATAMAISGAAFNPNMGYHSSPLVTLIMTLFNVRLGWWLPNPKFRSWKVKRAAEQAAAHEAKASAPEEQAATEEQTTCPSPSEITRRMMVDRAPQRLPDLAKSFLSRRSPLFALRPLILEALGGTNDEGPYIELTDGGHFENLGLYEMVMRRVKWIVVIDGSADPECQLEDLGNAMRKIEIDLGVPINFKEGIHMRSGEHQRNLYCALADIRYDIVDYVPGAKPGRLLYIKAGLNGGEPPDVLQYARTHPAFPHEATANQFFTESQFESYRHLGHHEVATLSAMKSAVVEQRKGLICAFFDAAENYTHTQQPRAADKQKRQSVRQPKAVSQHPVVPTPQSATALPPQPNVPVPMGVQHKP